MGCAITKGKAAAALSAAVALALFLSAGRAASQPTDPTPEASFAGVWRIVGARAAPWAKPHKLEKREAPLLEYAVIFAKGEVRGPSPLGCAHAKFATTAVEPEGLFQGNLPKAKARNLAKALNLQTYEVTTARVNCDTGSFDYHFDNDGNLQTALDNVIYLLERPEPMDAGKVKPGYSGPSFDCLAAKSAAEKLICLDADLSRADREMAAAYARLRKTESPGSFATVQASQRAWLAYVMRSCGGAGALPQDLGEKNALKSCLTDNYDDRAQRLSAAEVLKTGPLVLEPRMRLFTRAKPDTEESDIYPWMSGGPQAAPFNAWIAKDLQLSLKRMDDKDLFPFDNSLPEDMKLYAHRTYSVVRFDARIVSLQIVTYDYTGGAHEVLGETALNWDLARSKPIALSDLFANGKPWKKFATEYCLKELHAQFNDQDAPDPDRSAVESVVADGGNWLLGKDKATIHFTVYSIASFSGGEFDVQIPYSKLKAFLRPDAPVL